MTSSAYGGLDSNTIAYKQSIGKAPGLIWCGGLKSDMDGTKAAALHQWADEQGRAFVRFDYFGHGVSSGAFRHGTISRWAADTVQVIDQLCQGPQIIIGSSMGGWAALLAALSRPECIKALVLLAPAPDFTEKLMWAGFSDDIRKTIMEDGIYYEPSDYDEPYEISRELILDGRQNLLLDGRINIKVPVRIIHGMKDTSVPWQHGQKLVEAIASQDIELNLIKNADHSLSRPADIAHLLDVIGKTIDLLE
ncbi:MAG: alpha/beta hydrolase [Robiginitomaculum sp.]|nr:MAG: alpha/beta hydrolase [Robiginitomaculum sp.]